jgi:hypothetical protein
MGKSATVSVSNIFSSGFALPTALYALPHFRVIEPWLADFLQGGGHYATHLLASARNIELLAAARVPTLIVHVRDPRQQIIAEIGHVRLYASMIPPSVRATVNGDVNQTVAFAVEKIFPDSLAWIERWVKARDRLPVHFTTFEEFIRNRDQFVDRLLSLYGGDTRFFDRKAALEEHSGIDYHRRLGSVDEWRSILSPQQTERLNSLIPDEYWNLFGWTP